MKERDEADPGCVRDPSGELEDVAFLRFASSSNVFSVNFQGSRARANAPANAACHGADVCNDVRNSRGKLKYVKPAARL
jgi:hypothetical protein